MIKQIGTNGNLDFVLQSNTFSDKEKFPNIWLTNDVEIKKN